MTYTFYDSKVINIIDEAPSVKRYVIQFSDTIKFNFKAAQFVILDLPIVSNGTLRSYSIASAPSNNNIFELCVVGKTDGSDISYLFNEVKTDSVLKVSMPLGKCIIPYPIENDICFICTGTGIAPFRSYLLDLVNKNIPHKNIYLIVGNRWVQDILYKKELEELEQSRLLGTNYKFIPVLSRESEGKWSGRKGYVHPVYEELFADKRPAHFYIFGGEAMLCEARQRIGVMGYDLKRIRFELYDSLTQVAS